ncbi:MAG: hypothetical protein GIKADHBN_00620 [Phycisphaerales bacterium]|nr:hypothetical protein [Phycisphaerales bacterium]
MAALHSQLGVFAMAGAVLVSAAMLTAGPLDPPAGPVAPTNKTLHEVEPRIPLSPTTTPGDADSIFRITQPGSYYLTGNLTGVSGKSGIEIASSYVTVDLNGFTLTGVSGSLSGITRDVPGRTGLVLRNGSVVGWGAHGVQFTHTDSNGAGGGRIDSVIARANAGSGFYTADGSILTHCHAAQNGDAGFNGSNHTAYTDCVATGNAGSGFVDGFGCTLTGCQSRGNQVHGFDLNGTSVYSNCDATNNGQNGFVGLRSTFVGCGASTNSQWGFDVSISTVQSCSSHSNTLGGILVTSSSTILDNSVVGGASGIRVTGVDNRIEGNNSTGATICIEVTGTGNLIIRNSASGGTRYSIVAGNSAGPIVTSAGMGALTNPAANFDY